MDTLAEIKQILLDAGFADAVDVSLADRVRALVNERDDLQRRVSFVKPPTDRAGILDTAKAYITKDRAATHGGAEDSFRIIAGGWQWYLDNRKPGPLDAVDIAIMMAIFKVARATTNRGHTDNWIDMAGYAGCGGEIAAQPPKTP